MTFVRGTGTTPGSVGAPLQDLVGYVDIGDEGSYPGTGTEVTDFQANLSAGTITGATYANGALVFDGASGDLSFTKGTNIDNVFAGGGAIMVFFRALSDGEGSAGELVNSGFNAISGNGGYRLLLDAQVGNSVRINFYREWSGTDGNWRSVDLDTTLSTWHSIAIVYDEDLTTNDPVIYLDGKSVSLLQVSIPTGSADTDVGNPLILGNRAADDRTFAGDIATFLAWDIAITAETVSVAHTAFMARHGSATGINAVNRPSGDLILTGGDNFGTSSSDAGKVLISGGDTNAGSGGGGGNVRIRSGNDISGGSFGDLIVLAGRQTSFGAPEGIVTFGGGTIGTGTISEGTVGHTTFRGTDDYLTSQGGDTVIRGGDARDGTGSDRGGDLYMRSGQNRNASWGGHIYLRTAGPSDGTGNLTGSLYLSTQVPALFANPFGGGDTQGDASTRTGNIHITTEPGATATDAGSINLIGGDALTNPGDLIFTAGDALSTGFSNVGGNVEITAGDTNGDNFSKGGSVTVVAGSSLNIGANTDNPGGDVSLTAGQSNSNDPSAPGGNFTADAGISTSLQAPGGVIGITAGNCTNASAIGPGGTVTITGGYVTEGGSTGNGGDICLQPGIASGSGLDGKVIIKGVLDVQTSSLEATTIVTSNEAAGTADPIAINPGTSSAGNDGADLTLSGGTGDTDGEVVIKGPTNFKTSTGDEGGSIVPTSIDLTLAGKDAVGGSGLDGNDLIVEAGAGDGAGDGGDLRLKAGVKGGSGTRGAITFATDTVNVEAETLEWVLIVGPPVSGDGTSARVAAADGFTTNDSGGDVTLEAGLTGGGTGTDGNINLRGDNISLQTQAGVEGVKVSFPGSFDVEIAGKDAAAASGDDGTTVTVAGGAGDGAADGGSHTVTAGNSGTGATGDGGSGSFKGGNALSTNGSGGNFTFTPGTSSGTGTDGEILFAASDGSGVAAAIALPVYTRYVLKGVVHDSTSDGTTLVYQPSVGGTVSGNGGNFEVLLDPTTGSGTDGVFSIGTVDGAVSESHVPSGQDMLLTFSDGDSSGVDGTGYTTTLGAGNTAASGGSDSTTTGASGTGASGDSGSASLTIPSATSTNGSSGSYTVTIGGKTGSGNSGNVLFAMDDFSNGANFGIRTQSTFTGTIKKTLTHGVQHSATGSATTNISTIGTLGGNGRNMKFTVYVTAQESGTDSSFVSAVIEQSVYGSGGSAFKVTAFRNVAQGNGALGTDLTFDLTTSGFDTILRVINANATTYTINVALTVEKQEGGFSS